PDVERVQDGTHAGHSEVGLEMLLVVPAERPDRIVRPDPEPVQRPGQPRRVLRHLGVTGPAGAGPGPRHALTARVHPGSVPHDRGNRERVVLHGAADHRRSSSSLQPYLLGGTVGPNLRHTSSVTVPGSSPCHARSSSPPGPPAGRRRTPSRWPRRTGPTWPTGRSGCGTCSCRWTRTCAAG